MNTAVLNTYSQSLEVSRLIDENVISSWRFEDDVLDSIGSNNGVYLGVNNYGYGPIDKCIDFGHNSSLVEVNNNTNLSFTDGVSDVEKSISFLIKFDDTSAQYIFHKNDASNKEYQINFNPPFMQFVVFDGTDSANSLRKRTTFSPTIGQWYHISITYDSTLTMYIDGVDTSYDFNVGTYVSSSNKATKLKLGSRDYLSDQIFTGELDELKFFNIALTPSEVLELATQELAGNRVVG